MAPPHPNLLPPGEKELWKGSGPTRLTLTAAATLAII